MSRTAHLVGRFIVAKARTDRQARGTQSVARQLRKQGIPLWVALKALGIRPQIDEEACQRVGGTSDTRG